LRQRIELRGGSRRVAARPGVTRPTGGRLRPVDRSAADVPTYCATLGQAVSRAWSAADRQDGALPEVAARALAEVDVPAGVTSSGILEWAAATADLPPQSRRSDPFGQPPLVLHYEDDFFIQALIWMEGTTAIHDHSFCGAFMVLEGASLQVTYDFEPADRLADDRLVVGDLVSDQPEVLRPLDIRPIEPGGGFIHALFHLERPTVTIVVRNSACALPYPQYEYLRPGLGWNSLWEDRTWSKRLQSIRTLEVLDPASARRTVRELVTGGASLWEAFLLVEHWSSTHRWNESTADLVECLGARNGALADVLGNALEQQVFVRKILMRRGMLHALQHRALLALLANLPDAPSVTSVVHQLFPGEDTGTLLLTWAEELSGPDLRGVSGLSFADGRLAELRASPLEGREQDLLAEIRSKWGEPRGITGWTA